VRVRPESEGEEQTRRASHLAFGLTLLVILCLGSAGTADTAQPSEEPDIEVTRWMDPTGREPITHAEWTAAQPMHRSSIGIIPPPAKPVPPGTGAIRVLVRDSVHGSLTAEVDQYIADLTAQGYTVSTLVGDFATPAALRAWLQTEFANSQIVGAVLIGDWPVPWFEMDDDFFNNHSEFPCDLYYMDLDGTWTDGDTDGLFDSHGAGSGDVGLEIWVGRLTFSPLTYTGKTEVELLSAYFDKNHRYRIGQLCPDRGALAYNDDDWYDYADTCTKLDLCLTYGSGNVAFVTDPEATTRADYRTRYVQNREFVHVMSHGSPGGHGFYRDSHATWEWMSYTDVIADDPAATYYLLYVCSACRYVETDYVGGWYVNGSFGLVAIGSTKTGGLYGYPSFYTPMSTGATVADAYFTWFNQRAVGGFDLTERRYFYGLTVLGDPTLGPLAGIPDPYEANDACASAYDLGTVATQFSSAIAHFEDANQDWFTFAIAAPAVVVVDTTLHGASADTVIGLYDTCGGAPLATNDDYNGTASHIEYNAAAGTYYLLIDQSGQDYGPCLDYSFTIALPPPQTAATFRVRSDGAVLADGTVHADSFQSGSADVAEWMSVSEPVGPGDVVELDPLRPGSHRLSVSACSARVAGVIATRPGMILGEEGANGQRAVVALVGIVPVKVTDEGGPVRIGDLLVTSSAPGRAMRWDGSEPCPCALVGKALEPMTGAEGVILVLLTTH